MSVLHVTVFGCCCASSERQWQAQLEAVRTQLEQEAAQLREANTEAQEAVHAKDKEALEHLQALRAAEAHVSFRPCSLHPCPLASTVIHRACFTCSRAQGLFYWLCCSLWAS